MSLERALPVEEPSGSLLNRIFAFRRLVGSPFIRDVLVPMIAFMGPLVAIVLIQFQEFGYGLLLGWDSSTYAWWATQVQQNGVLPTVVEWRYPNLYILILSGFGSLVGSVSFAEHVLPLIVSLPLGYSYYALTLRITNNRGLGLFAAFLGGVSMATIGARRLENLPTTSMRISARPAIRLVHLMR